MVAMLMLLSSFADFDGSLFNFIPIINTTRGAGKSLSRAVQSDARSKHTVNISNIGTVPLFESVYQRSFSVRTVLLRKYFSLGRLFRI